MCQADGGAGLGTAPPGGRLSFSSLVSPQPDLHQCPHLQNSKAAAINKTQSSIQLMFPWVLVGLKRALQSQQDAQAES